ncbi:MAG: hypothetical protein ACFCVE_11040 [Phycisphaerae bacterium]
MHHSLCTCTSDPSNETLGGDLLARLDRRVVVEQPEHTRQNRPRLPPLLRGEEAFELQRIQSL